MDVFGGGVVWGDNYGMVWISRILDWYTRVYRFRVKEELRVCNGIVPLKVVAVSQGTCFKQDLYLVRFSLNIVSDTLGCIDAKSLAASLRRFLTPCSFMWSSWSPPPKKNAFAGRTRFEVSQCWGVCCFTDLGRST